MKVFFRMRNFDVVKGIHNSPLFVLLTALFKKEKESIRHLRGHAELLLLLLLSCNLRSFGIYQAKGIRK